MKGAAVLQMEEWSSESLLRQIQVFKERIKALQEKCNKLAKHYTKKFRVVKKKREHLEKKCKQLRDECKALNHQIAAIGLFHCSKMLQVKIKYQMEIAELVSRLQLDIAVVMIKQMRANHDLQEVKALQRDNKYLLDQIIGLEEVQRRTEDCQRKFEELQDQNDNLVDV